MTVVRDDVTTYFKDRGITINVIGMKDGIEYDSKSIQESIDLKFSSEQKVVSQKNENDRVISEAKAKAEANNIITNSITDKLIQQQVIEKWNGTLPTVTAGSSGNVLFSVGGANAATTTK